LDGKGVDRCNFVQSGIGGRDIGSNNAEGYADDLTILFKMAPAAMRLIKEILTEFYYISGLEINKKKTQLMVTGTENGYTGEVIEGISVVDCVTLLGVDIDRKLLRLGENWEKCIGKITRMSNFWKIQRLGIGGRILVAKSYLLSQATYLLGCIPLPSEVGNRINEQMAQFARGTDRILARERWFFTPGIRRLRTHKYSHAQHRYKSIMDKEVDHGIGQ